jgi:soluble lytic murein transglycosylase-like protein
VSLEAKIERVHWRLWPVSILLVIFVLVGSVYYAVSTIHSLLNMSMVSANMYTRTDSIYSSMVMLGCNKYSATCYASAVSQSCLSYRVDWKMVIAQMRQESNFDPKVKSFVKTKTKGDKSYEYALGLMQIKPSTGEEIAGELGEEYHYRLLLDGITNIRWGVYYYAKKMVIYEYDVELAVRAYNSGDYAVQEGKSSDTHWERVKNFYDLVCKHVRHRG